MSRKTIAFTMPAAGQRPRERAPLVIDAMAEPHPAGEDEWVRDSAEEIAGEPAKAVAAASWPTLAFDARAGLVIDLAAERSLMETMALSAFAPMALGWSWWAHAMARRSRMWGF